MTLTLKVTTSQAEPLGAASVKVFGVRGGSIGRNPSSDWVLPDPRVSSSHARITFANGAFYIADTSGVGRNGVFLNARTNRLTLDRPYALGLGDRIFIGPYEIQVQVADGVSEGAYAADPFGSSPLSPSPQGSPLESPSAQRLDPVDLLFGASAKPERAKKPLTAKDVEARSPLGPIVGHYTPPNVVAQPLRVEPPSASAGANAPAIPPEGWDPFAPDVPLTPDAPPAHEDPLALDDLFGLEAPGVQEPNVRPPNRPARTPSAGSTLSPPAGVVSAPGASAPIRSQTTPVPSAGAPSVVTPGPAALDLTAVLEGVGLDRDAVTPELALSIGRIFRVVVDGVMHLLQARHKTRDILRMEVTGIKPRDNNPLKFSANVDDAVHNLFVKRNPAFLQPVEAFEEAFADLRNHQFAVLAGMRAAYESMLAAFDPDRLQEEFDRRLKKGWASNQGRYWERYRDRYQSVVEDPEASYARLFGKEFLKAYEEQLRRGAEKTGGEDST